MTEASRCRELERLASSLVGRTVTDIIYYLEDEESVGVLSDQPNEFGHSLLNGIDIHLEGEYAFSIWGGFLDNQGLVISTLAPLDSLPDTHLTYGHSLSVARSIPMAGLIGNKLEKLTIFWGAVAQKNLTEKSIRKILYPSELELECGAQSLYIINIEINDGNLGTDFTSEILLVYDGSIAKQQGFAAHGARAGRTFTTIESGLEFLESWEPDL